MDFYEIFYMVAKPGNYRSYYKKLSGKLGKFNLLHIT